MSQKHPNESIDQAVLEAAWRYQLIAPLLTADERETKRAYREELLAKPALHPFRGEIALSARTLRRWCRRYRQGGLVGLVKSKRRDLGSLKAFSPEVLEQALKFRQEDGRRSVPLLIELLATERAEWKGLARTTLDRHLRSRGSVRRLRKPQGPFTSFEAKRANDLWQGDVLHGPVVLVGEKQQRCRVIGWIDDFSRHVCHLQAYPDETLPSVEDSLKRAVLKYGLPTKIFVDNAWVYSGKSFTLACAQLGIAKIHSTPRYPVSRGKIERFFRTLRDQVLREVENLEVLSIDDLNRYLTAWVETYHAKKHSRTEQTPKERFLDRVHRTILNQEKLEQAFWQWSHRTVSGHGEIKFEGNVYRVDPSFCGQKVVVRYDPYDLSVIHIWKSGERIASATTERLICKHRKGNSTPRRTRDSEIAREYLENMASAHAKREAEEFNQMSFPQIESKEKNQ